MALLLGFRGINVRIVDAILDRLKGDKGLKMRSKKRWQFCFMDVAEFRLEKLENC